MIKILNQTQTKINSYYLDVDERVIQVIQIEYMDDKDQVIDTHMTDIKQPTATISEYIQEQILAVIDELETEN